MGEDHIWDWKEQEFHKTQFNPIALRTAKTPQSFGCSECNRVNVALAVLSAIGLM